MLPMAIIECIPNLSEGRRPEVVEAIATAIRGVPGIRLLDHSSDASHNRSVFTMAGDAVAVRQILLAAFGGNVEADLVEQLRANSDLALALVADNGGRKSRH